MDDSVANAAAETKQAVFSATATQQHTLPAPSNHLTVDTGSTSLQQERAARIVQMDVDEPAAEQVGGNVCRIASEVQPSATEPSPGELETSAELAVRRRPPRCTYFERAPELTHLISLQ